MSIDGKVGILVNYRIETDRAVIQVREGNDLIVYPAKFSELIAYAGYIQH